MIRVSFSAGAGGEWQVEAIRGIRGESLPTAPALSWVEAPDFAPVPGAAWTLHAVRSNERYVERAEKDQLASVQQGLGRADSRRGALRATEEWRYVTREVEVRVSRG